MIMPNSKKLSLTIATRNSRLAMWQAQYVQGLLAQQGHTVAILGLTTSGDKLLNQPLSAIGGKGLFIKELEAALLDGRADLAVHSLKDLPATLAPEFTLACVLQRGDARDVWVSPKHPNFATLPAGAVVGTSSTRRTAWLRALRPDVITQPIRGNLDTRLRKLDAQEYDGLILAAAGLQRLDLHARIAQYFEPSMCLPAPTQGILGIEIATHRNDLQPAIQALMHPPTWLQAVAERAVGHYLAADCSTPLAAYASGDAHTLQLHATWATQSGAILQAQYQAACPDIQAAQQLGIIVAQRLEQQGAGLRSGTQ